MIHQDTELRYISPKKGYGVVAARFIPKGTITWVGDPLDQVFTPEKVHELDPHFQDIINTYAFRDHNGNFVLCWDHSRFVNHSYNSNCLSTAYNFELAVRDIYPGEEITNDYGYLNLTEPFDAASEPGSNRTRVMPDDLLHYHKEWDEKLKDAFQYFNQVRQPLRKFIAPEYKDKIWRVSTGKAEMDSILSCYYDEHKHRQQAA